MAESCPPTRQRPLFWPLLAAALLFGLMSRFDFPKPYNDDLFYVGPALNMAGGGDFSNPLLARQGFPSHYYFVYPPFHSYAVYAWVSIFGVSVGSLLAFQDLMFFIISAMTMLILRHFRAPDLSCWLAPLTVTAFFLKSGLRPEPASVAATLAGYALFLCGRRSILFVWLALFLMCVGAVLAPRNVFFGACFAIAAGWEYMKQPGATRQDAIRFFGAGCLALVVSISLFLVLIRFQFSEFYQTFHLHSTRLDGDKFQLVRQFVINVGSRCLPCFLLTAIFVIASLRRTPGAAERLCYGLVIAFVLSAMIGALSWGPGWYVAFILLLMSGQVVPSTPSRLGRFSQLAVVAVLLAANVSVAIEIFGLLRGDIDCRAPENAEAIQAMQSTPEHPILISEPVARYVFHYKIPTNYLLYEFSSPFPGFLATDSKIKPEDVYVVGPGAISLMNSQLHTAFPIDSWSFFGLKSSSTYKYPCKVYVIKARDVIEQVANSSSK